MTAAGQNAPDTCETGSAGYAVETMTATPPQPDPDQTPGLEPGGGVAPGDTPPDAGSTAVGEEPGPVPTKRVTSGSVLSIILVAIFAVAFIAVAVGLVLHMTGVMG